MASIIERIDLGCASNPMRVLISLTAPIALFDAEENPRVDADTRDDRKHSHWYDRNTLWLHSRGRQ